MCTPNGYLDFRVRPLRTGDEEPLARFYASLSERSRFFFQPYQDTSSTALRKVVERAIAGVDLSLAVQDPEGEILGHIFYQDVAKEVPHLGIGLRDAYQDKGLGGALLGYLVGLGQHVLGKSAVGLTVVKENQRAFHLYKKHGFRVVREDVSFRLTHDSYEMWHTFATRRTNGTVS